MRGKGSGGRGGKRGSGRWKSRAAAADVKPYGWVVLGAKVEVRSDEEGFVGAWFVAEVVHLESPSSCVVEYDQLLADDGTACPLQEIVLLHNLRPCPPAVLTCPGWLPGHLVEAYDRDGWWAGVVVRSLPDLHQVLVRFRTTGEELSFSPSLLRGLQNWDSGKWTNLTQVGRPDNEVNAVDTNGSSSPLRIAERRKRGCSRKRDQPDTDLPSLSQKEVDLAMETDSESIPALPVTESGLHKKLSGYELCDMEKSWVSKTNGPLATSGELLSQQSELQKTKIRLEVVAYQLLVKALRSKGPLKWEHELLLSDVRLHLNITSEEQTFVLEGCMPSKDGRQ